MTFNLNRQGARDFQRLRAENSEKQKLFSLAAIAVQDDPDLTKSQFLEFPSVKKLELCQKSMCNYLVGFPFAPEPKVRKKREILWNKDIWAAGYEASELGKIFHQNFVPRDTALRN